MGLFRSPFLIVLVIIIALIAVFIWFRGDIQRAGKRAKELLREIDEKYAAFVKQRITLSILDDKSIDDEAENIAEEVMIILRPEINDLIAHINTTMMPGIKTKHQSPYFRHAVTTVDNLFTKSRKNPDKALTVEDIENLYQAFQEGIAADLAQRILDLKTGASL